MTPTEIKAVLAAHRKWLIGADGGVRANLRGTDLSRADLSGADLRGASLYGANLSEANLSRADLSGANLFEANLSEANLSRADLSGANLFEANLYGANLRGANLYSVKHDGGETMTGSAGDYWWCAFRSDAGVFLAYGCERHPLSWWREQDASLSAKHGRDAAHWRIVQAVVNLAATLETNGGEK